MQLNDITFRILGECSKKTCMLIDIKQISPSVVTEQKSYYYTKASKYKLRGGNLSGLSTTMHDRMTHLSIKQICTKNYFLLRLITASMYSDSY